MRSSRPGKVLDRPIATNRANFRHHLNERQKPGKICPSGRSPIRRFTVTQGCGGPHRSNGTETARRCCLCPAYAVATLGGEVDLNRRAWAAIEADGRASKSARANRGAVDQRSSL